MQPYDRLADSDPQYVDKKWVHGRQIPLSSNTHGITDPLAIVFDPLTLSFASVNKRLIHGMKSCRLGFPDPYLSGGHG